MVAIYEISYIITKKTLMILMSHHRFYRQVNEVLVDHSSENIF